MILFVREDMNSAEQLWIQPSCVLNGSLPSESCAVSAPFNYGIQGQALLKASPKIDYCGTAAAIAVIDPLSAGNSATLANRALCYGLYPPDPLAAESITYKSHHLGVSSYAAPVFPSQINASDESLSYSLYGQGSLAIEITSKSHNLGASSYVSPVVQPQVNIRGGTTESYSFTGENPWLLTTFTNPAMLGLQFTGLEVRSVRRRLTLKEIRAIFIRGIIMLFGGALKCLQAAQKKHDRISHRELNRHREKVKSLNPPIRLVFHTLHPDELAA